MDVLIVEDNKQVREFLFEVTGEVFGWEAEAVSNGLEAMEVIKSRSPRVVIADGMMPRISGPELVREIKKFNPEIYIIGISGVEELRKDFLEAGADSFLPKPVHLGFLKKELEEVLGEGKKS